MLVIVVVAAIAIAGVVALHGHGGAGAENPPAAGLADTTSLASSTGSGAAALDPAQQQPTLDQFTSRDPFIQATALPVGSNPTPTSSSSPATSGPAANIHLSWDSHSTTYTVQRVGSRLPSGSSVFQITEVGAGVSFALLHGYTVVGSGAATVGPIAESTTPTEVKVEKGSVETDYFITVLWIGTSSDPSGSTGSTGSSKTTRQGATHSIRVASIETANGAPSATIAVDGVTYAGQQVGNLTTTSWGQIKIVGINVPAQTVTILHADVQITLHVGQSVSQ